MFEQVLKGQPALCRMIRCELHNQWLLKKRFEQKASWQTQDMHSQTANNRLSMSIKTRRFLIGTR